MMQMFRLMHPCFKYKIRSTTLMEAISEFGLSQSKFDYKTHVVREILGEIERVVKDDEGMLQNEIHINGVVGKYEGIHENELALAMGTMALRGLKLHAVFLRELHARIRGMTFPRYFHEVWLPESNYPEFAFTLLLFSPEYSGHIERFGLSHDERNELFDYTVSIWGIKEIRRHVSEFFVKNPGYHHYPKITY